MKSVLWIAAFFAGIMSTCQAQKPEYSASDAHLRDTVDAPKAPIHDSAGHWVGFQCFRYDKLPVPVKGDQAFQQYLIHQVHYPIQALTGNITGRVEYAYDIDTTGRITNVRILRDIGGGCGDVVKNAVEHYPDLWTPAMKDGRKVVFSAVGTFSFVIETGSPKKRHKHQKHKKEVKS